MSFNQKSFFSIVFLIAFVQFSKATVAQNFPLKDTLKISSIINKDGSVDEFQNNLKIGHYRYLNGKRHGRAEEYGYSAYGKKYYRANGNYVNGLKEGLWIARSTNHAYEEKIAEARFVQGKLNGYGMYFYDGDTIVEGQFVEGMYTGKCVFYAPQMKYTLTGFEALADTFYYWDKIEEVQTLHGKKEGESKLFYFGKLYRTGQYINHLKEGRWIEYATDGEHVGDIYATCFYKNDIINGLYNEVLKYIAGDDSTDGYYAVVNDTSYFVDGVLNGPFIKRNEDGVIIGKGQYINGEFANVCGFLAKGADHDFWEEGPYINGKRNGKWTGKCADEDCDLNYTMTYFNDSLYGYLNSYTTNDFQYSSILFRKNSPVSYRFDYITGDIKNCYIVLDTVELKRIFVSYTIKDTVYYAHIKPKYIDKIENFDSLVKVLLSNQNVLLDLTHFKLDGPFKAYIGEALVKESHYKNNILDGKVIEYYHDQDVKIEFEFLSGILLEEHIFNIKKNKPFSGKFYLEDKPTNLYMYIKVKKGLRNGTTHYYDLTTNKKIMSITFKDGVAVKRIEY